MSADSDLRRFMKMTKQRSAHALSSEVGLRGVWQEGYHDWVIRPSEDVSDVIDRKSVV